MNIPGGWSKSPHQIYDAMPLMSGVEYKCTAVLVRETYGYHRRRARLTYDDFTAQTGIKGRATITATLKAIEARGFFRRTESPSEWQICELPGGEEEEPPSSPTYRRHPAGHERQDAGCKRQCTGHDNAAAKLTAAVTELAASVAELTASVAELQQANAELAGSNNELNRRLDALVTTIAGQNSSLIAPKGSADSSLFEPNRSPNSSISETKHSISAANTPAGSSKNEPCNERKSSKNEPLPYNKEKRSPAGQEREGEICRSGSPPHPQPPPPHPDRLQCSSNGRQAPPQNPHQPDRSAPHPRCPAPRSAAERDLAAHPALAAWLEAGFTWPGWERLAAIAGRLGPRPRLATLQQARQMWLMAGYRMGNTTGILDWYDELCRDGDWQPFTRRSARAAPIARDINTPQSPAMAMLFKMREEIHSEQEPDNSGLFDHVAVSLPPPRSRPANHPSVPVGAGRY